MFRFTPSNINIREEEEEDVVDVNTKLSLCSVMSRIIKKDKTLPVYKTEVSERRVPPMFPPGSLPGLVIHQAGLESHKVLGDE